MSTSASAPFEFTGTLNGRRSFRLLMPNIPSDMRVLFSTGSPRAREPRVYVPPGLQVGYIGSMIPFNWPGSDEEMAVARLPYTIRTGYAHPRLFEPLQRIARKAEAHYSTTTVLHGDAQTALEALTYRFTVAEMSHGGPEPLTLSLLMGHARRPAEDLGPIVEQGPTRRGGTVFAVIYGVLFLTPHKTFVQLQLQTTFFTVDGVVEVLNAADLRMPNLERLDAASAGAVTRMSGFLEGISVFD